MQSKKQRRFKYVSFKIKRRPLSDGRKRGNIFQKAHISFPLQLDNFQLEHGKQSEEILRKFFPEICEEVRGVSDAIGTDYLHFISWMLCMGCCMYNLENNIPVEVRGCTALHIQAMAEQYTVEIMTYHLICVKEAKVKSMHRKWKQVQYHYFLFH